MGRLSCFLLLLFAAIGGSPVRAQNGYSIRYYNTENGMSSNGIKGLQWDEPTGFLWIATESGLMRFNGIDFKNFNKDNVPGLTSERTYFLLRSSDGRLYMADEAHNLFTIDKNHLVYEEHYVVLPNHKDNLFLLAASPILFKSNRNRQNRFGYYLAKR